MSSSPDNPTSTYVNVTPSPYLIVVLPIADVGSVVTVWNTPVLQPVSSMLDGLFVNVLAFDSLSNSCDDFAAESHSIRDIAYDSHVVESRFKSGSVNVITISLPST